MNNNNELFEAMKQSMEYYYRTRDKFIIIENNYGASGLTLMMSIVNGKEYIIIGNNMCAIECIKIISKLYKEYGRIICDIGMGLKNCINRDLNEKGLYLNLEYLEDGYIKHLLRENRRLSVIGAYVESRQLTYNEKLIEL